MKAIVLLLALCATAHAQLPPDMPIREPGSAGLYAYEVKRPKPLLSPSHAAQPKSKPMVKTTIPGSTIDPSQQPRLPLKGSAVRVNSQFGTTEFTVEAFQPHGQSLLLEVSPVLGDWVALAYFGPQPFDQTSFASFYSFSDASNVRANVTPVEQPIPQTGWMPASLGHVVGTTSFVNTNMPGGVRTRSVRK